MKNEIQLVYFSPTGTTRAVLHLMAQFMEAEMVEHDFTPYGAYESVNLFGAEDFVFFGFPVYGGRAPGLFRERLRSVSGTSTPAVIICTCGNHGYFDALLEMRDIAIDRGFVPIAAAAVVTEHNVIRSVAAGRPDEKDKAFLKQFCAELAPQRSAACMDNKSSAALAVPGKYPYLSVKAPWQSLFVTATAGCIACGKCVADCPAGAIPAENPRSTQRSCIGCMRCTRICPKHARRLRKLFSFAGNLAFTKAKRVRLEPERFPTQALPLSGLGDL